DHATADRLPWADSSRPNDRIEQARRAQPTSSSPGYLLSLASSAILASSPQHFQPWQGAGAAAALVHLQSEALEHRDKEVAQRRVALRVEGEVPAVLEAAPGEQHRQVLDAVRAGVAQVLLKNTVVRSSRVTPSSLVSLSFLRKSRRVFIFSVSTFLSCSILFGSLPWCDRSWWPRDTPGTGGTPLVPSSCRVTSRVESVCRARWMRSNHTRVLAIRSVEFMTFWGGLALTFGFGFFAHWADCASRCSSSRTLV